MTHAMPIINPSVRLIEERYIFSGFRSRTNGRDEDGVMRSIGHTQREYYAESSGCCRRRPCLNSEPSGQVDVTRHHLLYGVVPPRFGERETVRARISS